MTYVYILESLADPNRRYAGVTGDLKSRLTEHNAGSGRAFAKRHF